MKNHIKIKNIHFIGILIVSISLHFVMPDFTLWHSGILFGMGSGWFLLCFNTFNKEDN